MNVKRLQRGENKAVCFINALDVQTALSFKINVTPMKK